MNHSEILKTVVSVAQAAIKQEDVFKELRVTSKEVSDETVLYKKLSNQLTTLEVSTNYKLIQVEAIREIAEKMFINIDDKAELLMRCEWLEIMRTIDEDMATYHSIEQVQDAKRQLARVQTCPLKKELGVKLEKLEKQWTTEKVLSIEEQLEEDIFSTGNEVFINLGAAGRKYVLAKVLKERPSVDLAISKSQSLESQVQDAKQSTDLNELESKLKVLPLVNLTSIPIEYKEEVLQNLLNQPIWKNLFHLDLLIKQHILHVEKTYDSKQEGIFDTLILDDKIIKKLGIQYHKN